MLSNYHCVGSTQTEQEKSIAQNKNKRKKNWNQITFEIQTKWKRLHSFWSLFSMFLSPTPTSFCLSNISYAVNGALYKRKTESYKTIFSAVPFSNGHEKENDFGAASVCCTYRVPQFSKMREKRMKKNDFNIKFVYIRYLEKKEENILHFFFLLSFEAICLCCTSCCKYITLSKAIYALLLLSDEQRAKKEEKKTLKTRIINIKWMHLFDLAEVGRVESCFYACRLCGFYPPQTIVLAFSCVQ